MRNLNSQSKEFLDIIDENDKIIGLKSRDETHQLGLLHREIHIWLFDKDHNIFFQKRGVSKTSTKGLLDAPIGGHVDSGESYINAALREAKEESGISMVANDLILLKKFRENFIDKTRKTSNNFLRYVYIYRYPIKESQLIKESQKINAGFQKLSANFVLNKKNRNLFVQFIITDEIPAVIKYLDN